MKYFTSCTTIEEVKKEYRRLAMLNHPDRGGDLETMKAINAEYDEVFTLLKDRHNAHAAEDSNVRPMHETPEEFRDILEKLIRIPGIVIELCGAWIWISGETKEHKEELKASGCRWANKKMMWYWRNDEDACQSRKGGKSMDYIRSKYGSERVGTGSDRLTA